MFLIPRHISNVLPKKTPADISGVGPEQPYGFYAYLSRYYTLAEVGKWFGVSYATVSRAVREIECKM